MNESQMPLYQCHKQVRAAKIIGTVVNQHNSHGFLEFDGYTIAVTPDWLAKHNPKAGGYLVEYEDGYRSFSPAKAFEEGYALASGELAMDELKHSEPSPMRAAGLAYLAAVQAETNDSDIEREIIAKGKTAPRVTPADIKANIATETYFTAADGAYGNAQANGRGLALPNTSPLNLLTFCVLMLRNGFTVTGESACASPESFDAEIGRKVARENAIQKCWPLIGYALKERLYQSTQPAQVPV